MQKSQLKKLKKDDNEDEKCKETPTSGRKTKQRTKHENLLKETKQRATETKSLTRRLLVALGVACLEISFIGSWCYYATFRFGIQNECYMS